MTLNVPSRWQSEMEQAVNLSRLNVLWSYYVKAPRETQIASITNMLKWGGGIAGGSLLLGLMAHAKPHVLILDEPTSHLDIDSREALIHAINEYQGAVLLITHDVYLAEACADRLWLVHAQRARYYEGDLDDYRDLVLSADRPEEHGGKAPLVEVKPLAAPPAKKSTFTLNQRLAEADKALERAQAALAKIDAELADPNLFSRDPARGAKLGEARAEAAAQLEQAEAAWLEASAALGA